MPRKFAFPLVVCLALVLSAAGALAAGKRKSGPTRTYSLALSGKNEVPRGAPKGSGHVVLTLNAKSRKVCWAFSQLKNVKSPTAAHIHKGRAGTSGAVVVPLGGAYKATGCTTSTAAVIAAIEAAPKGYYVNVHNAAYKDGAIRAQL